MSGLDSVDGDGSRPVAEHGTPNEEVTGSNPVSSTGVPGESRSSAAASHWAEPVKHRGRQSSKGEHSESLSADAPPGASAVHGQACYYRGPLDGSVYDDGYCSEVVFHSRKCSVTPSGLSPSWAGGAIPSRAVVFQ